MGKVELFQREYKLCIPQDWYDACSDWLRSQNLEISNKNLYEQWLLTDLRDIGAVNNDLEFKNLPENSGSEKRITLNGIFNLQINSIIDISHSFYDQLTKLEDKVSENLSITAFTQHTQVATPKRCLMLTLTDGKTECKAIEKKHCPSLRDDLSPGSKIRIKGPILFNMGVFILYDRNITILGGEVPELVELNTKNNILNRALGKELVSPEESDTPAIPATVHQSNHVTPVIQTEINEFSDDDDVLMSDLEQIMSQHDRIDTPESEQINPMNRETIAVSDPITGRQWLIVNGQDGSTRNKKRPSDCLVSPTMRPAAQIIRNQTQNTANSSSNNKKRISKDNSSNVAASNEISEEVQICLEISDNDDFNTDPTEVTEPVYQPWSYLRDIKNYIGYNPVEVKGYITSLVSKLNHNKGQRWTLSVKIDDGTDCITVEMSDKIMEDIIGFSSEQRMKYSSQRKDPLVNDLVIKAYSKCEKELREMSGYFSLKRMASGNFEVLSFRKDN